ncbi:MAG: hypothetical protein R3B70_27075 [Polyangiaceae bacterium]
MSATDSKLRVLIALHSRETGAGASALLGTDLLEPVAWGDPGSPGVVSELAGAVRALTSVEHGEPPDLVIADCTPQRSGSRVDPTSLVHAAVLAARLCDARVRPVGFAYFGSSWNALSEDPVAVHAYCLLRALTTGGRLSEGEGAAEMRKERALFSPVHALRSVMGSYRRALMASMGDVVQASAMPFEQAVNALLGTGGRRARMDGELRLTWTERGRARSVSVASLYADVLSGEGNMRQALERAGAIAELTEMANRARAATDVVDVVVKGLLVADKEGEARFGKGVSGYRAKVVAFIAHWAFTHVRNREHGGEKADVLTLLGGLGLSELPRSQRGIMDRALKEVVDEGMSTARLVESLEGAETWPFAKVSWLLPAVRGVLEELPRRSAEYGLSSSARWPRCLRG